ncbi:MAG: PLP-dependent aminotransferase family protein [Lachnospiraceae bacterium]|nr:PLP-dependent aminotransferase family protein [Lachnospiraceae bacterium]
MLTYPFSGAEPLYQQLYRFIRTDILAGRLAAGDKLPSKRALARQLNVSVVTVEGAYDQLVSEGFLEARPRVGYFAASLPRDGRASALAEEPDAAREGESTAGQQITLARDSGSSVGQKPSEIREAGIGAGQVSASEEGPVRSAAAEDAPARPLWRYDLSASRTPSEIFPFSVWARITRSLLTEQREALLQTSPANGILPLREAIARHLYEYAGLRVSPHRIVVGAGTEYLYGLLIQLLGFDKTYGVEWPGYQKILRISESCGVRTEKIALDESGIRPDRLRAQGVDIVHITPSHQYPTGITMPAARRYELLQWALGGDRYIIEDDYMSEFALSHRPIEPLFSIDRDSRVIYLNTFNRKLAATVRISYMVLPEPLAQRFARQLDFYACTVSTFEQHTLARFIGDGFFEKHINRLRTYYRHRRDALLEALRESPLAGVSRVVNENAGLHLLLQMDLHGSDAAFASALERRGIRLVLMPDRGPAGEDAARTGPGAALPASAASAPRTFIVSYTGVDPEEAPEVLREVYEAYREVERE